MRVLVFGGTHFLGRHVVEHLVAAGHAVTVFNRGVSPDPLPAPVERLRGDRDAGAGALEPLRGRAWDACVDVSGYTARQVRPAVEQLAGAVRHYAFVSAVSVYGDPQERPVREYHPRLPPEREEVTELSSETYGRLKATCENVVQEGFSGRCALLRPQIVVGPHDPSDRYAYWAQRSLQDGETLAPGDGSDHLQVIDVRDLARFVRLVVETAAVGAYNLAGPRFTWAEFVRLLGARNVAWVPAEVLRAAGVTEQELPLYRPERGPRSGLMDICAERAEAAGLTLTDPAVTLRDTREGLAGKPTAPPLSPERETELIRLARGH